MKMLLQSLVLTAIPLVAHAGGTFVPAPEPESLSLLAIGALGLVIALFRKRK